MKLSNYQCQVEGNEGSFSALVQEVVKLGDVIRKTHQVCRGGDQQYRQYDLHNQALQRKTRNWTTKTIRVSNIIIYELV